MKHKQTTLSLFLETGRIIRSRMEHCLPLPFAQCELLNLLSTEETPTMHDIATHFKITAPSATSLVDELVHGGYIERVRNSTDRREVRISLTAKGRDSIKEILLRRKKVIGEIIATLSPNDQEDFNRILTKIIKGA